MRMSRRRLLAAAPWALLPTLRLLAEERASARSPAPPPTWDELTAASEESVRRGTAWLMKTLHRDGSCGVDIGQPPDIGCTAMVGLALMSQGHTPVEGPRSREVRQIASYLLQQTEVMPEDDITSATGTQLQNKIGRHAHSFFAALFLSQVLGEGWDPEPVKRGLAKVVAAIARAQTPTGDWGTQSWAPTLGTVMGWIALRASYFAGFQVQASAEKTARHLISVMNSRIVENQGSWMHTLYKNATGIRVLYAMNMEHEPIAKKAFEDVLTVVHKDNTPFSQAGGEEYLAFHLITETMLQKGGEDWKRWFPVVRDKIIQVQNSDGSWTGRHCITSRTFCTAAALLVLTAPYRYLPISQQ